MTDWDAAYRAGETPWDKGVPSPALVAELDQRPLSGRVLVPGCGRGNDFPALLAGGADDVVGIDLSPTAVREGSHRFSETEGVSVFEADLFELPSEWDGTFDAIFEHTCFCAIPRDRRDDYVRAAARCLKPGGLLLAVFYLNPRDDPDPTLGPPFGTNENELMQRFSPSFTVDSRGPVAASFPERSGREALWRLRRKA
jgi:SAM-dependent methyltransferase